QDPGTLHHFHEALAILEVAADLREPLLRKDCDEGGLPLSLGTFEDGDEVELVTRFERPDHRAQDGEASDLAAVRGGGCAQVVDEEVLDPVAAVPFQCAEILPDRVKRLPLRGQIHSGRQVAITDLQAVSALRLRSLKDGPDGSI